MKNKLEYAKKAREAFINYINGQYDQNICNKISTYINKLENLTEEEEKELTQFINENTTNIEHIADIQIPGDKRSSIKTKFKRIIPMKLSKPSGKVYKANGNLKNIIKPNNIVKIRRLTKFKVKNTK